MDDMQGGLREAQRLLESTRLDQQYLRNIALFETVMPDAFEMLREHEPSVVHLSYDEDGFVSLVQSDDKSPMYDGDPRAYTEAQFAEYGRRPRLLASEGMRTPDRLEPEANAHLSNSDKAMDVVFGHPQESFEELPEYVNFLLMLGTGLGYQFELFLKATHVRHLCIIEPEIDIFWAACHTIDWRPILEHFSQPNHSFELIVGKDLDGCHHDLGMYVRDVGVHNAALPFVYEHLMSEKLAASFRDFVDEVLPRQVAAQGYFDDEQVGLAHTVRNLSEEIPVLQQHALLGGDLLDAPAFIIANGPSLDGALEFLRANHPKAVLFTCGTALGSLKKAGIKPDFHVESERSRYVVEWITLGTEKADREGVTLLALNTVHPEVLGLFGRSALAMKPNDAGTLFLSRYMAPGCPVINALDCTPTVGNLALSLVSALGFQDVYLFGMDLGLAESGEHHSTLSAHYSIKESHQDILGLCRPEDEHNLVVDGNFGGKVTTSLLYRRAKWSAEQALRGNPGLRCHNASDGLLIDGARPVRVEDIELAPGRLEKVRLVDEIFSDAFGRKGLRRCRIEDANHVFQRTAQTLETLADIARTTVRSRQQGMDVLDKLRAEITAMAQDQDDRHVASMLAGSVSMFSVLLGQALYRSRSVDDSVALYRGCVDHFLAFCEAARTKVDADLFAVDQRNRNLKDKLVVSL